MPSPHIRKPFAAAFIALALASAYFGFSTQQIPEYGQSDKGLHFVLFFALTLTFYWILELPRRRIVHLTLLTVTAGLAIGSEVLQALLLSDREFDPIDILANVLGSGCSLLLCSWYHKRMLERKRKNKHYDIVPGEEGGDDGDDGGELGRREGDVELGEGPGFAGQETGTVAAPAATNVTEELDQWDENAEDWEEEGADAARVVAGVGAEGEPAKKRTD